MSAAVLRIVVLVCALLGAVHGPHLGPTIAVTDRAPISAAGTSMHCVTEIHHDDATTATTARSTVSTGLPNADPPRSSARPQHADGLAGTSGQPRTAQNDPAPSLLGLCVQRV